jgi:hypothetical protein
MDHMSTGVISTFDLMMWQIQISINGDFDLKLNYQIKTLLITKSKVWG